MRKRTGAQRSLAGLVIAVAAAFCIAGGMVLTAFADPQPSDGQGLAAASTELTAQDGEQGEGGQDAVSYIELSWDTTESKVNDTPKSCES